MQAAVAVIVSLGVTVLLIPILQRCGASLGLLDAPGGRKMHDQPIPRVGGIAMAAGVVVALALLVPLDRRLSAYLLSAAVILLLGVLDDRFDLDFRLKLAAQLLAAVLAVVVGGFQIETVTLAERIALPEWFSVLISVIFIVGVTNAINMADGLDGLAGGTTLLCAAVVTALGFVVGDLLLVSIGAALCGALLGFLRFNTHPARVFMGDAGSQFLGFSVAVLAITATQGDSVFSAALPLLLLAFPLIDTALVIVLRLRAGVSPFAPDRRHVHHRLIALGLTHARAVAVIYAVQLGIFLLAYRLRFESDWVIVLAFALCAGAIAGGLRLLELAPLRGVRWSASGLGLALHGGIVASDEGAAWPSQPQRSRVPPSAGEWSMLIVVGGAIFAGFMAVALGEREIPADIGILAALLGAALAASAFLPRAFDTALAVARVAGYLSAVVFVYVQHEGLGSFPPESFASLGAAAFLALAVVTAFSLKRRERFELTPLDLLVAFLTLILPWLPGMPGLSPQLGLSLATLVLLLYSIEYLQSLAIWRRRFGTLLCVPLLLLASRAFPTT